MIQEDAICRGIFIAGFVVGSVIRAIYARRPRQESIARDHRSLLDVLLVSLASMGIFFLPAFYLLTPWLDFADYSLPGGAGWAGAVVFAAALWLLWRSHVDLGRNWTPVLQIRKEHALVTRGVYRFLRHPMYAAHWLWGIAQALLLQNWLAGPALLICFLPLYFIRAPREERMMLEHFREEYRAYRSRTGRIIPLFRASRRRNRPPPSDMSR